MESLLKSCAEPSFPAEATCVVSNRPDALGLAKAQAAGVRTACIDHRSFPGRQPFEAKLDAFLNDRGAEIVALAGFMRVLTPWFVERWKGRLINIHPSLLPLYKGLHTHERALEAGDREHGCTVHYVSEGVDEGTIIGQARVAVEQGDTADTLAGRVLLAEHILYPRCISALARGRAGERQEEALVKEGVRILLSAPPA